jgi:hypothetical protein
MFWLLPAFLRLESAPFRRRGVRLRVIGRRDRLPKSVLHEIERPNLSTQQASTRAVIGVSEGGRLVQRSSSCRKLLYARISAPRSSAPGVRDSRHCM